MEVTEEAELVEFDSMEGGGFVTASPLRHLPSFHLLSGLDKDVYYAVDVDYSNPSNASRPSLVMAVKQKFPDVDPVSFLAAFKRACNKKMFSKGKHKSFLLTSQLRWTPWFICQSQSNMEPTKSPDDQIAAFGKKGDTSFWPYDGAPSESSTPYIFKKAPTNAFLQSLKTKCDRDTTDPVYSTVETSRKKKAKLAHSPSMTERSDDISKQLFQQCRGFTVESIHQNKKIQDVDTVIKGFYHVVGVGIRYKADAVSNQLSWPYESDVCGVTYNSMIISN
jgi:hypothetical protein